MNKRKFLVVYKIKGTASVEVEAENKEEAMDVARDAALEIEEWDAIGIDEVIDQGEV